MEQYLSRNLTSTGRPSDSKSSALKLPHNVEILLAEVLPSDDMLDRPAFDAREFINRNFPDEKSLSDINDFVSRLRGRMKELDDSLSQASQDQSLAAHQALVDLKKAKMATKQLFQNIHDIQEKATQSEVMVKTICRDIKQLDYAKRNLQTTLTALKRLHMLVNAVDQLEFMSSQRNYLETASLLEAVNQLFTHFDGYTNVSKIIELHKTVRTLQEELIGQVFADFLSIGPMELLEKNFTTEEEQKAVYANLSAACAIVDALGKATREKLIHLFCDMQLLSYERQYGEGGDIGKWPEESVSNFASVRAHILLVQIGVHTPDKMDVTLLLKLLQRTIMFERDTAQRFECDKEDDEQEETELGDNGEIIDLYSTEGIKRKYWRKRREAKIKAQKEENEGNGAFSGDKSERLPPIRGIVSRSFDPFMTAYVALERKNMEQMINEVMSTDLMERNGQLPVFSSSMNMFAYIRNSIKRYSLSSSASTKVRLCDKQEEELCFVINTAEYCAETLSSLEEVIRATIDKTFSEAIMLSQEINTFHDVGAAAMKCIVTGLETLLDDELVTLYKANWRAWDTVGDESMYVMQMGEKLRAFVPVLRQMLSKLYFTNFCDKFAASFVPKILQAVMKCRKVNQVATQQLLLDVYALKTLFLQLPVLDKSVFPSKSTSTATVPSRYTKFVTNEIAKVENVLKLIGTPNEMLVESFKIMWPDGSAEDFQSIMSMKGLKKSEQIGYLETLGMQRKPTGKIAEMEGKMSDMTENWRKNMQNLAKVPFAFTTGMNANAQHQS
ncbi:unnamed protein product [Peronospora belbahrii]|uniref:Vps53 N-terminal domain-containing protein n=1 Tax=Peronospora belbahrii TaxID=622444 RepID=A0AAU9KUG9_9STRA|nr:unnamed protein product [Peronospora belbahrii]